MVSFLEGNDLSLELVVEMPQCLMLTDDILAVESRLLSIVKGEAHKILLRENSN